MAAVNGLARKNKKKKKKKERKPSRTQRSEEKSFTNQRTTLHGTDRKNNIIRPASEMEEPHIAPDIWSSAVSTPSQPQRERHVDLGVWCLNGTRLSFFSLFRI
jgi:hypothetical protein